MAKTDNIIKLPSLLSFERKLETSDALMYSGNWNDISYNENDKEIKDTKTESPWKGIKITPRFNRSTQSAHGIKDADKTQPNPVSSGNDDANLPHDKDTLKTSFTLRVIGNVGKPFACNDFSFESAIKEKVNEFKKSEAGLEELAFRYAYNIVNGRFLWRNQVCVDDIIIHVFNGKDKEPLKFNPVNYSLNKFDEKPDDTDLQKLKVIIKNGLDSENDFVFLQIDAYVRLGNGQHVYPSEEMNMNEKGKTLFKLDECAAMHNVKIGNAIRTIDTWYGEKVLVKEGDKTNSITLSPDDEKHPIAIEPYGSVTQRGCAYRAKKNDLYELMVNWVNENSNENSNEKSLEPDDKNYVVANLIRGGVFSRKSSS